LVERAGLLAAGTNRGQCGAEVEKPLGGSLSAAPPRLGLSVSGVTKLAVKVDESIGEIWFQVMRDCCLFFRVLGMHYSYLKKKSPYPLEILLATFPEMMGSLQWYGTGVKVWVHSAAGQWRGEMGFHPF
jgi:hypothetical protein